MNLAKTHVPSRGNASSMDFPVWGPGLNPHDHIRPVRQGAVTAGYRQFRESGLKAGHDESFEGVRMPLIIIFR